MPKKIFDKQLVLDLHRQHMTGVALYELAKTIPCYYDTLGNNFRYYNLPVLKAWQQTNTNKDETYFENIDSEMKAYTLGIIMTDGSVGVGSITIALQERDSLILDAIHKDIRLTNKIGFIAYNKKNPNWQNQRCLNISSKKMIADVKKLGVPSDKSHKEMNLPQLRPDLMRHLIRGIVDGDGSISIHGRHRRNSFGVEYSISITSTSLVFLKDIKVFLNTLGLTVSLYSYKNRNAHTLSVTRKADVIKLHKFLYENSDIAISRKKDKIKELMLTPREHRLIKESVPRRA